MKFSFYSIIFLGLILPLMMEGQIGDLGRGFIKVNLGQSQNSYQVKAWADHEYEFEESVKVAGITLSYPFTTSSEGFNLT